MAMNGKRGIWRGRDPVTKERISGGHAACQAGPAYRRDVPLYGFAGEGRRHGRSMLWITLLVGSVVVLLFFAMSVLLANRIARPIRNLTRVAEQMAEGDWSRRAALHDRDEIGRLAETLNTMASELTRREKLKEDFISSVSHELRTPLTSIKGWSETLASAIPADPEELQLGLSIIDRETDRLSGLVEDLLDFSKLSAKSIVLHPETLDLRGRSGRRCGSSMCAAARGDSAERQAGRRLAPMKVRADANRLKQVFINVLDNALKFTPRGGSITISAAQEYGWARISIADSGCGISPEDLPHVTDKFYKGESTRSGSGLGLAICNEIVELHGGAFHVDSIQDEGTTVTIRLPLILTEQSAESGDDGAYSL